jgi:serine/threonine protein kinase/tetratricopeptide (TPR) repeat protein
VSLQRGERLGPYEIESPLGAGGMGEVYRARDHRLGRSVAVKVLPQELAGDADRLARFEREARATAALNHPNLVVIHDIGASAERPYLVLELLDGETLRERLEADGRLPAAKALDLARQLVAGLAAAHEMGVVHRDLKPENLFVTRDGRLKILDFGLAAGAANLPPGEGPTLGSTEAGLVLGTPGYLAPEQARGQEADARADLFASGAILYEMLSGEKAFGGETVADRLTATLATDPLERVPELPAPLARLLRRCLEKRPAERFQSARDLGFALEAIGTIASGSDAGTGEPRPAEVPAVVASVGVLPFSDLSPARDQGYFCDGIAEEILNALTRIDGLRVASRSASFCCRSNEIGLKEAARVLGVRHVLEGSVRRAGERARVTVRLVDGENGFQVWSERFDRELSDVFAVQDEIAERVVLALTGKLGERERGALGQSLRTDLEAYEWYLRGRRSAATTLLSDLESAVGMYRKALAIDPAYAPAWAGIADALSWKMVYHGGAADRGALDEASRRAVELAPGLAEARAARANALSLLGRPEEAEAEFRRALELGPRTFEARYLYGRHLIAGGRRDEAIREFEVAETVRPDDYQLPLLMAAWLAGRGDLEASRAAQARGLELARRRLALQPREVRALYLGAGALVMLGQRGEGLEWLARARELAPRDSGVLYNSACTFVLAGELDEALACLEAAAENGFAHVSWVENDPDLGPLHGLPRFVAALSRMRRN